MEIEARGEGHDGECQARGIDDIITDGQSAILVGSLTSEIMAVSGMNGFRRCATVYLSRSSRRLH